MWWFCPKCSPLVGPIVRTLSPPFGGVRGYSLTLLRSLERLCMYASWIVLRKWASFLKRQSKQVQTVYLVQ